MKKLIEGLAKRKQHRGFNASMNQAKKRMEVLLRIRVIVNKSREDLGLWEYLSA